MMNIPANLLYASSHEWLLIEGNEALIGITDYAQHSLGDITYVDLPQVGDSFDKGQDMGAIESVKAASDFFAPIACEVIAINENLDSNWEVINKDPYKDGWLVRVKINEEAKDLLSASEYADIIK